MGLRSITQSAFCLYILFCIVFGPLIGVSLWMYIRYKGAECMDSKAAINTVQWLLGFVVSTLTPIVVTFLNAGLYFLCFFRHSSWSDLGGWLFPSYFLWLFYAVFIFVYGIIGAIVVFKFNIDCKDEEPPLWIFSCVVTCILIVIDIIMVLLFFCFGGGSKDHSNSSHSSSSSYGAGYFMGMAAASSNDC